MASKQKQYRPYQNARKHFAWISLLSLTCVFVLAMLSRAELRLSGEVLGAGGGDDLARMFALNGCSSVERLRSTAEVRLHLVHCKQYDYVVESTQEDGEWEIRSIEKVH